MADTIMSTTPLCHDLSNDRLDPNLTKSWCCTVPLDALGASCWSAAKLRWIHVARWASTQ